MSFELPPFAFLILGGLILPLVPSKLRAATFLLFPALALAARVDASGWCGRFRRVLQV